MSRTLSGNLTGMAAVIAHQPIAGTYIMYHKQKTPVTVESTFQGATGLMVNVKAVEGFPFLSDEPMSQGDTFGAWNCNGYRVRADFVMIEHAVELASALETVDESAEIQAAVQMFGGEHTIRPTYDELISGAKFTNEHRAEVRQKWNEMYSDEAVQERVKEREGV